MRIRIHKNDFLKGKKKKNQENKYISTSFLPNFKLPFNNLTQILDSLAMTFYDLLKQRKTKNRMKTAPVTLVSARLLREKELW